MSSKSKCRAAQRAFADMIVNFSSLADESPEPSSLQPAVDRTQRVSSHNAKKRLRKTGSKMTQPRKYDDLSAYPEPVVFQPKSGTHRQSFILLRGRGSNGHDFADGLMQFKIWSPDSNRTLQCIFPDAKFIFLTASKRRAQAFNRSLINQWFDLWDLRTPRVKEELQYKGLSQSSLHLRAALESARQEVGRSNTVVLGLSQGCALGLLSLLLWPCEAPAAFVGMCGWVPLADLVAESLEQATCEDLDPFERSEGEAEEQPNATRAASFLAELLGVEGPDGGIATSTPIFLGHGVEDQKVDIRLGRQASIFLKSLGYNVALEQYSALGHWYSVDMLKDVISFIEKNTSIRPQHDCGC